MWLYDMLNSLYRPNSISRGNLRLKIHLRSFNVLVYSPVLGLRCIVNVFFFLERWCIVNQRFFFPWKDDALSKLKELWIRLGHFGLGKKISLFPYQSKWRYGEATIELISPGVRAVFLHMVRILYLSTSFMIPAFQGKLSWTKHASELFLNFLRLCMHKVRNYDYEHCFWPRSVAASVNCPRCPEHPPPSCSGRHWSPGQNHILAVFGWSLKKIIFT